MRVGNAAIQALLERAVIQTGLKQNAAKAIGVKPSRFSKLLSQKRGDEAPNVGNCFRLAALLGESPQVVLRAAGKADVADAMDEYAKQVKAGPPLPLMQRQDPLVRGVAEVVTAAQAQDLVLLEGLVNLIRERLDLPAIARAPGRTRAGSR